MTEINWNKLIENVADAGETSLKLVLSGAEDDIKAYAKEMSKNFVEAYKVGREDLIAELRAQSRLLGEKHRLTTVNVGWDFVSGVFEMLSKLAVRVATGGIL